MKYSTDPFLWHERIALKQLQGSQWLVLTPDRDIVKENVAVPGTGAIAAVRMVRDDGSFLGKGNLDVFNFGDSDEGDLDDLRDLRPER